MFNRSTDLRLRLDRPNSETIPIICNSFKALKNRELKRREKSQAIIYKIIDTICFTLKGDSSSWLQLRIRTTDTIEANLQSYSGIQGTSDRGVKHPAYSVDYDEEAPRRHLNWTN